VSDKDLSNNSNDPFCQPNTRRLSHIVLKAPKVEEYKKVQEILRSMIRKTYPFIICFLCFTVWSH
jgi:hypothetical protein